MICKCSIDYYYRRFLTWHTQMKRSHKLTLIISSFIFSSCVYYPKKIEYYDAQCDITVKKLVLETKEMQDACSSKNSNDSSRAACLVGVISLSALSAIISGSLVVVGNTAYWLEKEGKCIGNSKP